MVEPTPSSQDLLQEEMLAIWKKTRKGTVVGATGSGKTKVAIKAIVEMLESNPKAKILLAVPTTKLRDEGWKDEFKKWGYEKLWNKVDRSCYVSLSGYSGKTFDLLVADECHNFTANNIEFFSQNKVLSILGLTATPPVDDIKKSILKLYCPIVFVYKLDQAVEAEVIAPYHVYVVESYLDAVKKNITGGTKAAPFMTTEEASYKWLTKSIGGLMYDKNPKNEQALKFRLLARTRFIYNLPSKTAIAKALLDKIDDGEKRILVFCGSIAQSQDLCGSSVYHSQSGNIAFQKFQAKKLNRLGCVKALNEGVNLTDLDIGVIVQLNSNPKDTIQRIGRLLRLREGHFAEIYIIVCKQTQDEKWFQKAVSEIDPNNITYVSGTNFM